MDMPLPLVHRLRDLRIEQLEAQKRETEQQQKSLEFPTSFDADDLEEALEQ